MGLLRMRQQDPLEQSDRQQAGASNATYRAHLVREVALLGPKDTVTIPLPVVLCLVCLQSDQGNDGTQ